MSQENNIGTVWKVLLNTEEEQYIMEALEINKLSPDESGLKELILRAIAPKEVKPNKLAGFVEDNPEVVTLGAGAMRLAGALLNKKIFGK